jgi:hypothetical protein
MNDEEREGDDKMTRIRMAYLWGAGALHASQHPQVPRLVRLMNLVAGLVITKILGRWA